MSTTYPLYTYSSFPDDVDQFNRFTDLTLETMEYAKQYNTYMTNGNFTGAAQILIDHPELETSLINAANLNRIIDAIKCIETFYADDVQTYILELVQYKGTYSNSTKYTKYNVVNYNSMVYMCTSLDTPLGTLPTDTTYWYQLSIKGDRGTSGLGLSFEGVWQATVTYNKDSAVSYGTCLYASVEDNNLAHTPSRTSSYWELITDFTDITGYDNSSSGLSSVTLQDAIDELNLNVNNNKTNISTNASSINTINNKLNTIESGAQVNTVTGVKGGSESSYRTGNINITKANIGLGNVDNTADSNKSVKYATSAGTASSCSGNSATATNANYASSAGNCDSVDGFHFQISTTDLNAGSSALTTNMFYFVYE